MEAIECEQHAGPHQLLVVPGHFGDFLDARRCIGRRTREVRVDDEHHESHVVSPARDGPLRTALTNASNKYARDRQGCRRIREFSLAAYGRVSRWCFQIPDSFATPEPSPLASLPA